ncbi:MAG: wax ester/triacylglycerol synthase family O-acyltransferase, partial [Acidobacteriota bacterium]|nr:wax ester/triacylglycerol synthase family O-acyltransferase [Acidobacteriota bacterium]
HPYWVEDPNFDLDNHLLEAELPEPGGLAELNDLAARFFSTCLVRHRPLWEVVFVGNLNLEGYPEGCCVSLSKVHHSAIDGVSGAEIMGAMMDPSPEPRKLPEPTPWKPERIPSTAELLARTYGKAVGKTMSLGKFVGKTVAGTIRVAAGGDLRKVKPPPMLMTAPKTRLNIPVSAHRTFGFRVFPLERIKAAKNKAGATVNDLVLAMCAGALRAYLAGREDLPADKPLIAMAPISTRSDKQKGTGGNQVTGMLVSLATDIADPVERLDTIMGSTRGSKVYSSAAKVTDLVELIPSETAALATRLYCSMKVAERHNPFFNCIITNVPGPQVPLYMAGTRILTNAGMAPIFDGIGLIIVITSYNGTLAISTTSCDSVIPDIEALLEGFEPALAELEEALPVEGRERKGVTKRKESKLTNTVHSLQRSLDRIEALIERQAKSSAEDTGARDPES